MGRKKLPKDVRRSEPVYVLLRPKERRFLERLHKRLRKGCGTIIREAFLEKYGLTR